MRLHGASLVLFLASTIDPVAALSGETTSVGTAAVAPPVEEPQSPPPLQQAPPSTSTSPFQRGSGGKFKGFLKRLTSMLSWLRSRGQWIHEQMDLCLETKPLQTAVGGVLLLALSIVFLVPITIMELWFGYQFGVWLGFLLAHTGKILGCLASFALGRTVLQSTCTRCMGSNELLRALDIAVSREPYFICFLARASYVPIAVKNYGFAVRPTSKPAIASRCNTHTRSPQGRSSCAQVLSVPFRPFMVALLTVEPFNSFLFVLIGRWARRYVVPVPCP